MKRHARPVDVGVEQADALALRGQRAREVGGDGALADAALSAGDGDEVGDVGQAARGLGAGGVGHQLSVRCRVETGGVADGSGFARCWRTASATTRGHRAGDTEEVTPGNLSPSHLGCAVTSWCPPERSRPRSDGAAKDLCRQRFSDRALPPRLETLSHQRSLDKLVPPSLQGQDDRSGDGRACRCHHGWAYPLRAEPQPPRRC